MRVYYWIESNLAGKAFAMTFVAGIMVEATQRDKLILLISFIAMYFFFVFLCQLIQDSAVRKSQMKKVQSISLIFAIIDFFVASTALYFAANLGLYIMRHLDGY